MRSVLRFSFLSASPFIYPLPLVFICSLSSSTVCIPPRFGCRLLAVRFLWYLPANPPPPPLPPLDAFAILVFLPSAPVSLRFLSSLPFRFFASCCCFGSLSLSLSISCLFSVLGNAATGLPLCFGSHSFVVFSLYALASFSMRRRGGGGLWCCSFSVNRKVGTPMFVSSTLRGVCSLFFVVLSVFLCCSVFALLSSITPVSCACFPSPVFLFYCRSLPLRLSSGSLSSLFLVFRGVCLLLRLPCLYLVVVRCSHVSFFSLGVCLFLCFAYFASFLCLSSLLSLLQRSWGFFSFFAVGSGLFCLPSTLCSPFFVAVALHCASSGFPVSLACSVLRPHSLVLFSLFLCFRLGVLFFSPVGVPVSIFGCRLLRRFFATRGCPIWLLASPFSFFFFLLLCFSSGGSTFISQRFLVFPRVFSQSVCSYLRLSFLFFIPFRIVRSCLGLHCLPCFLPLAAYVA